MFVSRIPDPGRTVCFPTQRTQCHLSSTASRALTQQRAHQTPSSRKHNIVLATAPKATQPQEDVQDEFEGLAPDEDWVVPGGYEDSLSSNTELGRAVRSACDELDALNQMETEVLSEAEELLKKLGLKKSLFADGASVQAPEEN